MAGPITDNLTRDRAEDIVQTFEAVLQAASAFPASKLTAVIAKRKETEKMIRDYCERLNQRILETTKGRVCDCLHGSRAVVDLKTVHESPTARDRSQSTGSTPSPQLARVSSFRKVSGRPWKLSSKLSSSRLSSSTNADFNFDNAQFHDAIRSTHRFDMHVIVQLCPGVRESCIASYATIVGSVYVAHLKSIFQHLKEKVPKHSQPSKLSSLPSWDLKSPPIDIHEDAANGTMLLNEGLTHVSPIAHIASATCSCPGARSFICANKNKLFSKVFFLPINPTHHPNPRTISPMNPLNWLISWKIFFKSSFPGRSVLNQDIIVIGF